MTHVQFIALALAYSLAFLRLFRVIKPSYQYFPAWAQIGLTVAAAAVGALAGSLVDDRTALDLADSVLLAIGAGLAAYKGKSPEIVSITTEPAVLVKVTEEKS